jgi:hypothetical protein
MVTSILPGLVSAIVVGVYVLSVRQLAGILTPPTLFALEFLGCGVLVLSVVAILFPPLFQELLSYSALDRFSKSRK